MSRPKLPTEFSVAELLKALDVEQGEGLEQPKVEFDSPVVSFLQAFNLRPGTEKVSRDLLYELFKTWRLDSLIDKRNFTTQLNKLLPITRNTKPFYLVDKKINAILEHIQKHKDTSKYATKTSKHWQKHIERFLSENDLYPEDRKTIFVESDILFYVYNTWIDTNRLKRNLGYQRFIEMLSLYLERGSVTKDKDVSYGVSYQIKQLISKEAVQNWRDGRKTNVKISKKNYSKALYPKKEAPKKRKREV